MPARTSIINRNVEVGTIVSRLVAYRVTLGYGGAFRTDFDGVPVESTSWEGLQTKLDSLVKAARKAKPIAVPVLMLEHRHFPELVHLKRGVITGVHAANGNIMVRWDGAKSTTQLSGSEVDQLIDPERLDAEGQRELLRLHEEVATRRTRANFLTENATFRGNMTMIIANAVEAASK